MNQSMRHFVLQGHEPICSGEAAWELWVKQAVQDGTNSVGRTVIGDARVETDFVGRLDGSKGEQFLFETKVFDRNETKLDLPGSSTWENAEQNHRLWVEEIRLYQEKGCDQGTGLLDHLHARRKRREANTLLLLGAGFSKNWDGWLAREVTDRLLDCPEIVASKYLQSLLLDPKDGGSFEIALGRVQSDAENDSHNETKQLHKNALQKAIERVFGSMNKNLLSHRSFEFSDSLKMSLRRMLLRFDAIFTLNQDLLLEHRYMHSFATLPEGPFGRWAGVLMPGLDIGEGNLDRYLVEDAGRARFVLTDKEQFRIVPGHQPYFKLHGSTNWRKSDSMRPRGIDEPLMVLGANKEREIGVHPILSWYAEQFQVYLSKPNTRLMIIGCSFGDEHINRAIARAVENSGLRLFIVDPKVDEVFKEGSNLNAMFGKALVDTSSRSLEVIFGSDESEYQKLMSFVE